MAFGQCFRLWPVLSPFGLLLYLVQTFGLMYSLVIPFGVFFQVMKVTFQSSKKKSHRTLHLSRDPQSKGIMCMGEKLSNIKK
jgi:hypothetical protein